MVCSFSLFQDRAKASFALASIMVSRHCGIQPLMAKGRAGAEEMKSHATASGSNPFRKKSRAITNLEKRV
jgi:hypothetical protein